MSSNESVQETNGSANAVQKPGEVHKKTLEEDDEFEDFPVDTWPANDSLRNTHNGQTNLWEEDWDDVEVEDDFTKELKAELERNRQQQQ